MISAAEQSPPAGGAAFDQVAVAAAVVLVGYLPLAWFLLRERAGRSTALGRVADRLGAAAGLPRWVALPVLLCTASLLVAALGVYWDVPIHMQNGRDEGPLANPAHYPILLGILGFLASGVVAAGLARDPLPRRTVRFAADWRVPMGPMIILGAGLVAAAGFPADDVWHRLFGQDVTEWGPTHVMMIGGAVTCCLGIPLLLAEAAQVGQPVGRRLAPLLRTGEARATRLVLTVATSFCVIPMAFLMEFDLGVPQFPAATLFVISGFLTAWIFTTGRLLLGPGGALLAWTGYVAIRLLIFVVTLPVPDIQRARWLLFLGAALVIELFLLVVRTRGARSAAAAGFLAGSVGLSTEWWWMDFFLPYPLPPEAGQLPWLLTLGGLAGAGGGLLAWTWQRHLLRIAGDGVPVTGRDSASRHRGRWLGTGGVLLLVALMATFAPPRASGDVDVVKERAEDGWVTSYVPLDDDVITARVTYDDPCVTEDRCLATPTVLLDPVDAADDAVWLSVIAYQGSSEDDERVPGNGVRTAEMVPTGEPGEFRSAEPLPLYGEWKVLVRLHLAPTTMVALPLHMPEDPAIGGEAAGLVAVADGAVAPFVHEPFLLQRERKDGVPAWLWTLAYGLVIASWLGLLAFYGWCYSAAARAADAAVSEPPARSIGTR